jgi:hypothetical protein
VWLYNNVDHTNNSSLDDNDSTENEVEWVDNKIEDEAEQIFLVLMKSMEILKTSKWPLVNLGLFLFLLSSHYIKNNTL